MKRHISSINEDYKYEEAGWSVQAIFWIITSLVLAAGLLGIFGDRPGMLNVQRENFKSGYVQYEKFLRLEKGFETHIVLTEKVPGFTLSINKEYVDKIRIEQVIPEPSKVEMTNRRIIYTFDAINSGTITLFCDPQLMGSQFFDIEINEQKLSLSHFIYF